MASTLGEAHDQGWKIRVRCAYGKGEGMKRQRECINDAYLDLPTLLWTPWARDALGNTRRKAQMPALRIPHRRRFLHSPCQC